MFFLWNYVFYHNLTEPIEFVSHYSHTFYVLQVLYTHSDENFYCYTHITRQHIFRVNFRIRVFSISEKSLFGHFLKGVMFGNYHLILMVQTIRKKSWNLWWQGVQQNLNFQNQPQDYLGDDSGASHLTRWYALKQKCVAVGLQVIDTSNLSFVNRSLTLTAVTSAEPVPCHCRVDVHTRFLLNV